MRADLAKLMARAASLVLTESAVEVFVPGCGRGNLAFALADAGFFVQAMDIDAKHVEWCRSRPVIPNMTIGFSVGDAFKKRPDDIRCDFCAFDVSEYPVEAQAVWLANFGRTIKGCVLALVSNELMHSREAHQRVFKTHQVVWRAHVIGTAAVAVLLVRYRVGQRKSLWWVDEESWDLDAPLDGVEEVEPPFPSRQEDEPERAPSVQEIDAAFSWLVGSPEEEGFFPPLEEEP